MFYIIKPTHQKKVYVARALINRETELSIMCECHSATYAETIVEALALLEKAQKAKLEAAAEIAALDKVSPKRYPKTTRGV